MTMPNNTFPSFLEIGVREDLVDKIYRIDPIDTPFQSAADKVKATATNHEWQTQALAAASTSNAQVEGDDAARDAATATVRLGNRCQISRKVPAVTGTTRSINQAGSGDQLEYQEMLKGMELRRDMEAILTGANQAKVTSAAGTAPKLADALSWIKSNTDKDAGGSDPAAADGTGTRTDSGTTRAFTQAQLQGVIKKIYDAGGKPDTIMAGSFNRQQFSTFTGRGTVFQNAGPTIEASVKVFESDYGTLKVLPNRFMRTRDVLVLQMDMWAVAFLRKFQSTPIAKTGDSDARLLISEYTLEARNEKASGGVFDLTSA